MFPGRYHARVSVSSQGKVTCELANLDIDISLTPSQNNADGGSISGMPLVKCSHPFLLIYIFFLSVIITLYFQTKHTTVKKLHGSLSVLKAFQWLITPFQIIRATEIYLIAPDRLTFECFLDYFESRVITAARCC